MRTDVRAARIEKKLDTLVRLLALSITAELRSVEDRAFLLSKAGLSPRVIASLCDTSTNTINLALADAKRAGRDRWGNSWD